MRRLMVLLHAILALAVPAVAQSKDEIARRYHEALAAYDRLAPSPLDLEIEPGPGKAVKALIGAAGGTVTLKTAEAEFTLAIPEDALFYPEYISLVPVKRVGGLGTEATGALAVMIEPSGLPLAAPAWLSIKPKQADLFKKDFFPFGFSRDGRNAHYSLMRREEDGAIGVLVSHFSGFGAGLGSAATQALSQSKIELAPPDASRTARDAAAIGQETHGWWEAANEALSGAGETKTDETLTDKIKNLIFGNPTRPETIPANPIPTGGCGRLENLISMLNVKRATYPSSEPPALKPKLEPSQWDAIKACARPPAEICFSTGNPWPLVAYLKALRVYKPDAGELPEFNKVVAWLESLLKSCSRYTLNMTTKSQVKDKLATMKLLHTASVIVSIDVTKLNGSSKDVFTGADNGHAMNMVIKCNVKGLQCTPGEATINEPARIRVDLGDLPFAAGVVPGAGGSKNGMFNPGVTPAFVVMEGLLKIKGRGVPVEFEMIHTFWRCNFAKEFVDLESGFRFGAWSNGVYPVLYEFKPGKRAKTCKGRRPLEAELELVFEHLPDGTFREFQ